MRQHILAIKRGCLLYFILNFRDMRSQLIIGEAPCARVADASMECRRLVLRKNANLSSPTSRRTSVDFLGVRTLDTASFSADWTAVLTLNEPNRRKNSTKVRVNSYSNTMGGMLPRPAIVADHPNFLCSVRTW